MRGTWWPVARGPHGYWEPRDSGWYFVACQEGLLRGVHPAFAEVHHGGEVYWREAPGRGELRGVTPWTPMPFPPLPDGEGDDA